MIINSRNQAHVAVMTIIYNSLVDYKFGENKFSRNAEEMISELCECPLEQVDPYIKDTVLISLSKYREIVNAYLPYLRNWEWDRLPLLTQAILLMSYTHFYYVEKIDKKVVMNIAVDLAKKYVDDKQAKFINAILDHGVLDAK